jgi:hypothetical protein
MDLRAIRAELAVAIGTTGLHGYPSPRKAVELPCGYVGDPSLSYVGSLAGQPREVSITVNIAVSRGGDDDAAAAELDDLVSFAGLPAALQAHVPAGGVWRQLAVLQIEGGYRELQLGPNVPALVAPITCLLIVPTT